MVRLTPVIPVRKIWIFVLTMYDWTPEVPSLPPLYSKCVLILFNSIYIYSSYNSGHWRKAASEKYINQIFVEIYEFINPFLTSKPALTVTRENSLKQHEKETRLEREPVHLGDTGEYCVIVCSVVKSIVVQPGNSLQF